MAAAMKQGTILCAILLLLGDFSKYIFKTQIYIDVWLRIDSIILSYHVKTL